MASARILVEDGATAESVVASLESVSPATRHDITWDLSGLNSVPWLELPRLAMLLNRRRGALSLRIKSSTIVVPNTTWKRVLTVFFGMYTPNAPVAVATAII